MKQFIFYFLFLLFVSCDKSGEPEISLPTEEMAEKIVEDIITLNSEDKVSLVEFKKVNGIEMEHLGADAYGMEFTGSVIFNKSGLSAVHEKFFRKKGFLLILDQKPFQSYTYYKQVEKGTVMNITGVILFLNTENGWVKDRLQISLVNNS